MAIPDRRSKPYQRKNEHWIRQKHTLTSHLNNVPWLLNPLRWVWRTAKNLAFEAAVLVSIQKARFQGIYGPKFIAEHLLWISPQAIEYSVLREFPANSFKGKVIGGDWDRLEKRFDDLDIFRAVQEVCRDGKPWSETVFYQWKIEELNQGRTFWGCSTQQAFDLRCKTIESLYRAIQKDGYKTQEELASCGGVKVSKLENQEIGVCVGRFGDMLFTDGAHRAAIAKVLQLEKVPVMVVVRHAEWAALRKQLLRYARKHRTAMVQPAPHPDLFDIPCNKEYERLFDAISEDMKLSEGRVLEIGAQFGYFCHRFEEQGFECTAMEERPEELHFLKALRRAEKRQFLIIDTPIALWVPPTKNAYDAILAVNVLSRAENLPDTQLHLLAFLQRLSFRKLYLLSQAGGEDSYPNTLAKQLNLQVIRPLYQTEDKRILYLLAREEAG